MNSILYLLMFLVLAYFADGSSVKNSTSRFMDMKTFGLAGRIVNGTKANPKQFPHQVSLRRSVNEGHFCGGSIISEKLVLTAAHCMYNGNTIIQPWTILVVAGELNLVDITTTGQRRGVKAIKLHPKFNNMTLENDLAILELSIPFSITSAVRKAPLPNSNVTPRRLCAVSGWGYPASNIHIVSNDLMYVKLPIRTLEECRKLLIGVTKMYPGMFCAGFIEGGKDACQGDSGGGMICNGVLAGVVSGGLGCALPKLPGVYSDVYYFRDWIDHNRSNISARDTPRIMLIVLFVLSIMIGL